MLATATRSFDRVVQSAGEETIEEVMHTDKTREYAKSMPGLPFLLTFVAGVFI